MIVSRTTESAIPGNFGSSGFFAVYRQGLLTNVLNPKVALFFLAFMPQFITAECPSKFGAFVILGLCFTETGTLWCLCLAWFSSLIGERVRRSTGFSDALNRIASGLFVFLGIRYHRSSAVLVSNTCIETSRQDLRSTPPHHLL
jgi:threonine/homoserine/homoserine lactone efflux protein